VANRHQGQGNAGGGREKESLAAYSIGREGDLALFLQTSDERPAPCEQDDPGAGSYSLNATERAPGSPGCTGPRATLWTWGTPGGAPAGEGRAHSSKRPGSMQLSTRGTPVNVCAPGTGLGALAGRRGAPGAGTA